MSGRSTVTTNARTGRGRTRSAPERRGRCSWGPSHRAPCPARRRSSGRARTRWGGAASSGIPAASSGPRSGARRRFADRAEAERADGDPELRASHHQRDVLDRRASFERRGEPAPPSAPSARRAQMRANSAPTKKALPASRASASGRRGRRSARCSCSRERRVRRDPGGAPAGDRHADRPGGDGSRTPVVAATPSASTATVSRRVRVTDVTDAGRGRAGRRARPATVSGSGGSGRTSPADPGHLVRSQQARTRPAPSGSSRTLDCDRSCSSAMSPTISSTRSSKVTMPRCRRTRPRRRPAAAPAPQHHAAPGPAAAWTARRHGPQDAARPAATYAPRRARPARA